MTTPVPDRAVWFVDRMRATLVALDREVREQLSDLPVQVFWNPAHARDQLVGDSVSGPPPCLVVSDQVGLDIMADGQSLLEIVHQVTPLTGFGVYSGQARGNPDLEHLQKARQMAFFVPKAHIDDLVAQISTWVKGWADPVACKLRSYIATCSDPEVRYLPDSEGGYLNLYDVHFEIVWGTSLGQELQEAWAEIFTSAAQ